jgi:hypothetical protein
MGTGLWRRAGDDDVTTLAQTAPIRRYLSKVTPKDEGPWVAPLELQFHRGCDRITAAICPFSGLTNDELSDHLAGILRIIDEADRRPQKGATT